MAVRGRNLTAWAENGVLMLNTCLTVRAGSPGSHSNKGWEQFTDKVVDVVDRYARLAHDPGLSGIAAVVAAGDILRPRGADVAIAFYEKALPEAKIPAVQRAIRLQLVDLYKVAGKQDQALEQLKAMMSAEQGSEPVQSQPPPPPGR